MMSGRNGSMEKVGSCVSKREKPTNKKPFSVCPGTLSLPMSHVVLMVIVTAACAGVRRHLHDDDNVQ